MAFSASRVSGRRVRRRGVKRRSERRETPALVEEMSEGGVGESEEDDGRGGPVGGGARGLWSRVSNRRR